MYGFRHKLCAKYDPSSSGYPDILFTMSLMAKMPPSEKRGIIQSNIHFTKVIQIICIMYLNSMPDIICSSASPDILLTRLLYYIRCQSRKRDIIQSNIYRVLPKVNQVIYFLYAKYNPSSSGSPDILLTRFHRFTMHIKKRHNSAMTVRRKRKKYRSAYFSCLFHILNFKILSLTILAGCNA